MVCYDRWIEGNSASFNVLLLMPGYTLCLIPPPTTLHVCTPPLPAPCLWPLITLYVCSTTSLSHDSKYFVLLSCCHTCSGILGGVDSLETCICFPRTSGGGSRTLWRSLLSDSYKRKTVRSLMSLEHRLQTKRLKAAQIVLQIILLFSY